MIFRKFASFAAYSLFINCAFGQITTEAINFNNYVDINNNDLKNNFRCYSDCMSQITTGGITGGALDPPSTTNSFFNYCSQYKNKPGKSTETSLSFKYNSTLVNPNTSNTTAIIELSNISGAQAFVRWNHVINSMELNIYTRSWVYSNSNNSKITLNNLHWYNLKYTTNTIGGAFGDEIYASASLFDLGLDGLSTPSLVKTASGTFYDQYFVNDTSLTVSISGSKQGGASLLDNFIFKGEKSLRTSCAISTLVKNEYLNNVLITFNPHLGLVNVDMNKNSIPDIQIDVWEITGKQLTSEKYTAGNNHIEINTQTWQKGNYIIVISDITGELLGSYKILKQ